MKLPKPAKLKKQVTKSSIPDFAAAMDTFTAIAQQVADEEVEKLALEERDRFIEQIEAQAFPSFKKYPLSPKYLALKLAKGADARVMIATGTYKSALKVFRRKGRRGVAFRIGFHGSKRARDLDGNVVPLTLNELAAIQEFGSAARNIPARAHWRPFIRDMERRAPVARRHLARTIAAKVMRALQ